MQDDALPDICQSDAMDPARAAALAATLGLARRFSAEDALPPFFHQVYFWDARPAERSSRCEAATHKQGRSGPLGFVGLRHEIRQDGRVCVTEWQDLVYREEATPAEPAPVPPAAPDDEEQVRERDFSTTVLFRYSALTFNGHRIHYDLAYSRETEGYAGLVVHGPLLAQFLMLDAEDALGPLAGFSFRATAPLLAGETGHFCRRGRHLWVRGPDGRLCMTAEALPRSE